MANLSFTTMPPTLVRSWASVAFAIAQPWPGAPIIASAGTSTPSKNTSLKSDVPVSSRSGRTVTPGADMSRMNALMPLCFGASAIGAGQKISVSRPVPVGGPHLLAVDGVRVAVAYRAGAQRRQVAARPRLAEQLTPQFAAGPNLGEMPPALFVCAVMDQRVRRQHATALRAGSLRASELLRRR